MTKTNQNGVALLLALGVMSLLLVMVLGFATNALIERKVAAATGSIAEARNLAHMAMNRSIAAMIYTTLFNTNRVYTGDTGLHRYDRIVSRSDLNTAYNENIESYVGLLDALRADTNSIVSKDRVGTIPLPIYRFTMAPVRPPTETPQWVYVRVADSGITTPSNERIIGRYAYTVLPDMGSIDPTAVAGSGTATRVGADLNEIHLPTMTDTFNDPASATLLGATQALPPNRRQTPEALFADVSTWRTTQLAPYAYNMFLYGHKPSPESFHYSKDAPDAGVLPPEYHRFNLARTDWDDIKPGEILMHLDTTVAPCAPPDAVTSVPYTRNPDGSTPEPTSGALDVRGIPHLAFLSDSIFEPYPDENTKRWQIAANLIDQFDTDGGKFKPTSDIKPEDWSATSMPAYTGNEKTPYINEIAFIISSGANTGGGYVETDATTNTGTYTFTVTPKLLPLVELVNMYDTGSRAGLNAKIIGLSAEFSLILSPNPASPGAFVPGTTTGTLAGNADCRPLPVTTTVASGKYLVVAPTTELTSTPLTVTLPGFPAAEKDNVQVTIKLTKLEFACAILEESGENVDFVRTLTLSAGQDLCPTEDVNVFEQRVLGISFYCKDDPRNNLYPPAWVQYTMNSKKLSEGLNLADLASMTSEPVTDPTILPGDANGKVNTGQDDPCSPVKLFSNATAVSLAELAYVHRAEKNYTLNIGVTDGSKINFVQMSGYGTGGGSTYAAGDGNILDQVKIGNQVSQYGKIDINTRSTNLWRALLDGTAGIADSTATATNLRNNLRTNNNFFKTRASLFVPDSTGGTNTPLQIAGVAAENLSKNAGQIAHLIKAEPYPEIINVLVVAQSIKDVGGVSITKYESAGTPITKNNRLGEFDFQMSTTSPSYPVYFDEITGECKLLARIRREGNSFKILSIEYLTE